MNDQSQLDGQPLEHLPSKHRRLAGPRSTKWRVFILIAVPVALTSAIISWQVFSRRYAAIDPFDAKAASSVQFPLYYPTSVPAGYHTDPRSVTEPAVGVILFNLVGPDNQKIFISEEARPKNPDIGGAYKKLLIDPKSVIVSDGSITTGKLISGSGVMGSRVNNQVWIICNSHDQIPLDQLQSILRSMSRSF